MSPKSSHFGDLQGSQLYSGESWVLKYAPSCSSCLYESCDLGPSYAEAGRQPSPRVPQFFPFQSLAHQLWSSCSSENGHPDQTRLHPALTSGQDFPALGRALRLVTDAQGESCRGPLRGQRPGGHSGRGWEWSPPASEGVLGGKDPRRVPVQGEVRNPHCLPSGASAETLSEVWPALREEGKLWRGGSFGGSEGSE